MAEKKVSLQLTYTWPKPDLHLLLEEIRNIGLAFVGNVSNVWGSMDEPGDIPVQHAIRTLEDCDALVVLPKDKFYLSISSSSPTRSLTFSVRFSSNDLRIIAEVEHENNSVARQLLLDFGQALGAKPLLSEDQQLKLISAEREYHYPKPVESQPFVSLVTWFEAQFLIPPDQFELRYLSLGTRRSSANLQKFKEELTRQWSTIEEIRLWIYTPLAQVSINVNADREELRVEISKVTQSEVDTLFEALQSQFQLNAKQGTIPRQGESRRYLTRQSLDSKWVSKTISMLDIYFNTKRYFVGRYTLNDNPSREAYHEDLTVWQTKILDNWSQVASASMQFDEKELRIEVGFDPLRDQIQLRVEAINPTKVQEVFHQLEKDLELEILPVQIYGRKTSGYYEIRGWRKDLFAQAIETAMQQYVGDKFALTEAYLDIGPAEKRETEIYTSFPEFLKRIGGGEEYPYAKIAVEGPHGKALAVEAYDEHQKLYISSTFESGEFEELEGLFKTSLRLTKISDETDKPPGIPAPGPGQDILKYLVTALVGFLLSSVFWANIFTKYNLSITLPQVTEGETLVIGTTKIPVEWVLESEQWFQKKVDRDSYARIRVLKDGILPVVILDSRKPGTTLELEPGSYVLEVVSIVSQQADTIRVSIEPPENQP